MLHELILDLGSCKKNDNLREWTRSDLAKEVLHPGELTLINSLFSISDKHKEILNFIEETTNQFNAFNADDTDSLNKPLVGLYVKAFSNGLEEVLKEYKENIIELEQVLISNPQLTLTYMLTKLIHFATLFSAFNSMISKIKENEIHGCLLIGALDMYFYSGMPCVNDSKFITKSVNQIFYSHLANWIIYGRIRDVFKEFFICDAECPDEYFLYKDQSSDSTTDVSLYNLGKVCHIKKPAVVRKFYINEKLLPSVIGGNAANLILVIGRLVWILTTSLMENENTTSCSNVWKGKELEYYRRIMNLQNEPFSLQSLRILLDECKLKLSESLRSYMFEEANLMEHFALIRDYYGLGRGELFQQFIIDSETYFEKPLSESMKLLNITFTETAISLYTEKDKTHNKFELVLVDGELRLNFDIKWPLHIFFHPKAMDVYNKLFSYLLRLKKTNVNLHKLWFLHIKPRKILNKKQLKLRLNLKYFVDSVEYYIQVDVIETEVSILRNRIKETTDFEKIIRLHADLLAALLSKCFVVKAVNEKYSDALYQVPKIVSEDNSVHEKIVKMLDLTDSFCKRALDQSSAELGDAELNDYIAQVGAINGSLLQLLEVMYKKNHGLHLIQLASKLNKMQL